MLLLIFISRFRNLYKSKIFKTTYFYFCWSTAQKFLILLIIILKHHKICVLLFKNIHRALKIQNCNSISHKSRKSEKTENTLLPQNKYHFHKYPTSLTNDHWEFPFTPTFPSIHSLNRARIKSCWIGFIANVLTSSPLRILEWTLHKYNTIYFWRDSEQYFFFPSFPLFTGLSHCVELPLLEEWY